MVLTPIHVHTTGFFIVNTIGIERQGKVSCIYGNRNGPFIGNRKLKGLQISRGNVYVACKIGDWLDEFSVAVSILEEKYLHINKGTMMVLCRSLGYKVGKVDNEDNYQIPTLRPNDYEKEKTPTFIEI